LRPMAAEVGYVRRGWSHWMSNRELRSRLCMLRSLRMRLLHGMSTRAFPRPRVL